MASVSENRLLLGESGAVRGNEIGLFDLEGLSYFRYWTYVSTSHTLERSGSRERASDPASQKDPRRAIKVYPPQYAALLLAT